MAVNLSASEWALVELISETYALPDSPQYMDPTRFNRFLRIRVPPRGGRFTHDHRDTCVYIERSKNLNVVAYTAYFTLPRDASGTADTVVQGSGGDAGRGDEGTRPHHHHLCAAQAANQLPAGRVFAASGANASCDFSPLNPIHPYFVNLEPSYVAARRKKGIEGDCDDLNMLERRFAYGYHAKVFDPEKHILEQFPSHMKHGGRLYTAVAAEGGAYSGRQSEVLRCLVNWWGPLGSLAMNFVALPDWPAVLVRLLPISSEGSSTVDCDADTIAVLIALIDGKLSVLEKIYVKSIERWLRLPSVEYIEVFGVGLMDGKPTYEKQANDGGHQPPTDLTKEEMAEAMRN